MPFSIEIWHYPLLFVVGCLAGFLNVIAGGGSLMTMPVMTFIGMTGPMANGTNRVAILAQNISATIAFMRQKISDLKLSILLAVSAIPGTFIGAQFGLELKGVWFNRVLAGAMIAVLALMVLKRKKPIKDDDGADLNIAHQISDAAASRAAEAGEAASDGELSDSEAPLAISTGRKAVACLCMAGVGLYGGFLQAGVGFIVILVLQRVLKLDMVRINMHKVFIIGSYTIVALAIFAADGKIVWGVGIALALGNSLGAWCGSHWQVKQGERVIQMIVRVAIAVMALALILRS
jgi:uncharacterized membrane protein YfcA